VGAIIASHTAQTYMATSKATIFPAAVRKKTMDWPNRVRLNSVSATISWSHAATYQQLRRNCSGTAGFAGALEIGI
jgi:hypothetical protein